MEKIRFLEKKGLFFFLQIGLIFSWLCILFLTSSYFGVYALCGLFAVFAISCNRRAETEISFLSFIVIGIFSVIFSGLVLLANYNIFLPWRDHLGNMILVFLGGITVARNILLFLLHKTPMQNAVIREKKKSRSFLVFLIPFLVFSAIYLIYLFGAAYPGNLSPDSIDQVTQTQTGAYLNHHPFWHTILIKCFISIGKVIFHNMNAAVAFYCVVQLLFLASAFSFSLMTLYQAGVKLRYVILCGLSFALLPYHIVYSVTVWKDVVIGAATVYLLSFLFRYLNKIGNNVVNASFVALFTVLFCVWRSNAFLAMVASVVFILIFFRKKYIKLTLVLFISVVVAWFMRSPLLSMMKIGQADFVESLSIPVQQIARVIVDQGNLTEEEFNFLYQIMDVEEVPSLYLSHLSDPIKNEIRSKDQSFLVENKVEFAKIWIKIGLRNPASYVKAWVDQTKGYYNSGYSYWMFSEEVAENNYGIHKVEKSGFIPDFFKKCVTTVQSEVLLFPLISIGFWVWILMSMGITAFLKNRKETILYVPLILVIATLLIATPVYSEFRYAYSVFTTLPFLIAVGLHNFNHENEKGEEKNG